MRMNGISRKVALLLSTLALLSLPIGMMTARAHTQTYGTNVSIHYDKQADEIWGHLGTSSFCQEDRSVQVFKDGSSIGTVVSVHAGMWSLPATGAGDYQAVAALSHSTGYDHDHTCLEGSSSMLTVK
jgi:hypothetical protein